VAVTQLWHELYSDRFTWATTAYQEFLATVHEDVRDYFVSHEREVTVVLYGRTQVGKTTLLLKLLGIRDDEMDRVVKVLRGGRAQGKSATCTAIRYGHSHSNLWLYKIGNTVLELTDDQLEEALAELRYSVESGTFDSEVPIGIHIPSTCFLPASVELFPVNVLDLPGLHAASENERNHVRKIAERYVPVADLILLVGHAHHLGFLKPEDLVLPQLDDWRFAPQRFRIILTHTASADSFKRWLQQSDHEIDKREVRGELYKQLKTHDYEIPEKIARYLYPVEYGDSWQELELNDPDLFARVCPFVSDLMAELVVDINQSATEYNRIRHAFLLHDVAARRKNARLDSFKEQIDLLQNEQEELKEKVNLFEASLKKVNLDVITAEGRIIDNSDSNSELVKLSNQIVFAEISQSIGTNKKYFYSYLADCEEEIKGGWDTFWNELRSRWDCVMDLSDLRKIDKILARSLDPARDQISAHTLDEYYPNLWGSDYDDDVEAARDAARDAEKTARTAAVDIAKEWIAKHNQRNASDVVSLKCKANAEKLSLDRLTDQVALITHKIMDITAKRDSFLTEFEQSIQKAGKFVTRLRAAFKNRFQKEYHAILGANEACEKFIRLCFVEQLIREYKNLREEE